MCPYNEYINLNIEPDSEENQMNDIQTDSTNEKEDKAVHKRTQKERKPPMRYLTTI